MYLLLNSDGIAVCTTISITKGRIGINFNPKGVRRSYTYEFTVTDIKNK